MSTHEITQLITANRQPLFSDAELRLLIQHGMIRTVMFAERQLATALASGNEDRAKRLHAMSRQIANLEPVSYPEIAPWAYTQP